jgi:hypothetical protein
MVAATHSPLFRDEPLEIAFDQVLSERSAAGRTFCRRDLMDDAAWYGSGQFESVRRPMGIDDCIYSIYPLRKLGQYACLGLHRAPGELPGRPEAGARFGERERLIADFVWQALGFLHEQALVTSSRAERGLPAGLRPVLAVLCSRGPLSGAERKLGMSVSAFRCRCGEVYRFFGVSGRQGLLLKLANARP